MKMQSTMHSYNTETNSVNPSNQKHVKIIYSSNMKKLNELPKLFKKKEKE